MKQLLTPLGFSIVLSAQFDPVTYTVAEGEQVALRCTLNVTAAFNATIDIITSGSATCAFIISSLYFIIKISEISVGIDFDLSNTSFSFTAGATESFIVVTATDDVPIELTETIQVNLTNPSEGLVIGAASTATVTITENDGEYVDECYNII